MFPVVGIPGHRTDETGECASGPRDSASGEGVMGTASPGHLSNGDSENTDDFFGAHLPASGEGFGSRYCGEG